MNRMVKLMGGLSVVAMLIVSTAEIQAFPLRPNMVTIRGDRGGQVIRYAIRAKKLTKQNRTVRFAGRCDSACTLYLSMPGRLTCITRGASFGFHLPYGASPRGNKVAAKYMMKSYPNWVRKWIRSNHGLSKNIKTMHYSYASKYLRSCNSVKRIVS